MQTPKSHSLGGQKFRFFVVFETHHGHVESELYISVSVCFQWFLMWNQIHQHGVIILCRSTRTKSVINMWAVHQQQMVPLGKVSCEHVCYPDKYGQGTALRSMKLPSKTGESSPQRIFRRGKNHPSKWGDGGERWVSFPSSPGLPKMMFMSKADFFCWGHFRMEPLQNHQYWILKLNKSSKFSGFCGTILAQPYQACFSNSIVCPSTLQQTLIRKLLGTSISVCIFALAAISGN